MGNPKFIETNCTGCTNLIVLLKKNVTSVNLLVFLTRDLW